MNLFRIVSRVSPVVALLSVATGLHAQAGSTAARKAPIAPPQVVHVDLAYRSAREGVLVKPNFSPKGTQVSLTLAPASAALPAGASRPAKVGTVKVGPGASSYMRILATSSPEHPSDLTSLYLDRNRNGRFDDDGPPVTGVPTQNAKTKAWWTSINKIELTVPYAGRAAPRRLTQQYLVNFWMVREDSAGAPDVLRYSTGSWRYGTAVVNGVPALVAAMDGDNDALFAAGDMWSVMPASTAKAETAVLSINEARETKRLMFLPRLEGGDREQVLQFKSFSPDGSGVDFLVINAPVTKAQDRAPDDMLRDERPRPRTETPVVWGHGAAGFDAALVKAKASGRKIFLDFEATWCGPCHTMDEWIWTDAEVASLLNAGYVGVKIDVDVNKPLVARFKTTGYPTMIILDSSGAEVKRVVEYQSSKAMMLLLGK